MMNAHSRTTGLGRLAILALLSTVLVACGGGGGGRSDSVAEVPQGGDNTAPPPPPPPAPPEPVPYREAEQIFPVITLVEIPDDGRPIVEFQISDGNNTAILDLTASDIRFAIAKLLASPLGSLTGDWQSYVNEVEQPGVGPGTEARLQATAERGTSGTLENNGDGSYRYQFAQSISEIDDPDVLPQAEAEGIDLDYEPDRTHRVAMQFSNSATPSNPIYDWVPATGATAGLLHRDIVAIENCNGCHEQLALHGGGRIETRYCVTCHNPGSSDANSGNTVDFKVMVHKIHRGRELPSVEAGGEYAIWGFRDTKHDYSHVGFPRDIRDCQLCHGGTATGDDTTLQLTSDGDDWSQYASQAACGSCHDELDFSEHYGGQADDANCMNCHQAGGAAGGIADSHRNLVSEASERFAAEILSVSDAAPGEFPTVQYRITDPTNGNQAYDLQNDPEWTQGGGASRLAIDLAWSTTDYTNTGNGDPNGMASAVSLDALAGTPVGDGSYLVQSSIAIPDGGLAPGIAATGSGGVAVEGHPAIDFGSAAAPQVERIPFPGEVDYFSIDEADGQASPRRSPVLIDKCQACHGQLSLHGSNRTDNMQLCALCHNPRNTDREVRTVAVTPPTDGKDEESLDFKTMVHGIHGAAMRENPLQIVGFRGFSTHVYDEEHVHYPGRLSNCLTCHNEGGYTLPLDSNVLATTVDTGGDHESPEDDTVISPMAAVCSSCHDGSSATAHMEQNGASFATTQGDIDAGLVFEQCDTCHAEGRSDAVSVVHEVAEP